MLYCGRMVSFRCVPGVLEHGTGDGKAHIDDIEIRRVCYSISFLRGFDIGKVFFLAFAGAFKKLLKRRTMQDRVLRVCLFEVGINELLGRCSVGEGSIRPWPFSSGRGRCD